MDTISKLNKPVSRIFFGTAMMPMLLGGNADTLLDGAVEAGITAFDCARGYGMAEKSLGGWVKRRGNREQIVILSKCGNMNLLGKVHVDRKVINKELEKSLKTLGTEYIDIYLLHRDDPKTPVSEYIETLNEAKQQGKIRLFGASNWTDARIREANRYAESHGLEGFSVASPNYGLAIQVSDPWGGGCVTITGRDNEQARRWYVENQMPIVAYSSLGRGFFSGKFKAYDFVGAKKTLDKNAQKGYLCDENMRRLKKAEELAAKYHSTVAQIAMRYVFSSDMNVYAVVSSKNPARLKENLRAASNPLSAEDVRYLEDDA